jgi:protein tyrosine phosphatase
MIWEQRIELIAMLTKLEEGKVLKAHRYWPTKGTKEYGDITVTLISNKSKHNDSYRVKVFTVQRVSICDIGVNCSTSWLN